MEIVASEKDFQSRLTTYSLSELEDVFAYLDRHAFPERHALVAEEIERRLKELDSETGVSAEPSIPESPGLWRRVSSSFVDVSIQALVPFIIYYLIQKTLFSSGEASGPPRRGRGRGGPQGVWGDVVGLFDGVKEFFVTLFEGKPETVLQLELICGWVLMYLGYRACWHILGWMRSGSTPGMKELGIKLTLVSGGKPGFRQAVMRFVLHYVLFVATFGVSGLWMLWDKDKRALHDKLSGTQLVVVPRSWEKGASERRFD